MVDSYEDERRDPLRKIRSRTIMLRRYLAPQRDALTDLLAAKGDLFDDDQRGALGLATDRIRRFVEALDSVRDRAIAVHEDISTQLAERMNITMFRLAVATIIFLPLMLLTGLLSINVGGMPGIDGGAAFCIVVFLLLVMGVIGIWLMRKWKMI